MFMNIIFPEKNDNIEMNYFNYRNDNHCNDMVHKEA